MTDTRLANLRRTVTREFPEEHLLTRLADCQTYDDVLNLLMFIIANLGYDRLIHEIEQGIARGAYTLEPEIPEPQDDPIVIERARPFREDIE